MDFNIKELIEARSNELYDLYERYINKQFVSVIKTIGFNRSFTRSEGYYLYDASGKKYLDFITGYGVFALGRNHPVVVKAVTDFIDSQSPHLIKMDCSVIGCLVAEALISKCPRNIETVFFTSSGTEGIETAIKFAACATKRDKFVFLDHAFHGLTCGALSLNGNEEFREGFPEFIPGCIKVRQNDLDALELALRNNDIAAFVFEPIQGKGVNIPNDDYLTGAEHICRKYGTLLIADEIQTGLGRTGKFFAFEHWGLTPDIIVISKALSGGLIPAGAVLSTRPIHDSVFSRMDRCMVHSSTFSQNGPAMAAALAALHIIDEENILRRVQRSGKMLLDKLNDLANRYELIDNVRGKGLMIAIEFGRPQTFGLRTAWDMVHRLNKDLFAQMVIMPLLDHYGIITQVAGHNMDVIKLLPAFTITDGDIDYFIDSFGKIMEGSKKFPSDIWNSIIKLAKNTLVNRA